MLIIISLKKLTATQKTEIRKYYSLIEYEQNRHGSKNISQMGNCELVWFSIIPSIVGTINNNTFKYLLNHIEEMVTPRVVIVYDKYKYRRLLTKLEKIANFIIPDFPKLQHKNLEEILSKHNKKIEEKKEPKNLLLESTEDDEDSDVDFDEINILINSLQKKYKRLKSIHSKEKEKQEKLKENISSLNVEIVTLREQVSSLKSELKEKSLQKPELKRTVSCESPKEELIIVDENNHLVVRSSLSSKVVERCHYKSRRDKQKKLAMLRKKYKN